MGLVGDVGERILANPPVPLCTVPARQENELMLRVQAGDLEAFEQLVGRYQNMVYGLALSILRNPEDAEEAAQDAFVKLFVSRQQFDTGRDLEPWLLRIAGNAGRDRLRRRRATRQVAAEDAREADARLQALSGSEASGKLATQQLVRSELARLSARARLPLELKYLRGLTNQQIADALGVSVSNVKVQLARAKDVLQSRLQRVLEA